MMSLFVRWLDAHRRSILFLFVVLAAGGVVSVASLPIGLFPRTTFPRVVVSVDAGDRPAGRMVIEVTRPLEDAIRAVQGVRDLRSTSSRGACDISVNFDWGTDMISRTLMVEAAIARILPSLPDGSSYEVRRMDPTVFPVLGLSMRSPKRSLIELRDRALYDLRPRLSTIRGVASIDVLGGRTEELQVLVDPVKLAASGVTLDEVVSSVSAANVVEAIGRLQQDEKLYLLLSDTQLGDLNALRNVVVQRSENGIVSLGDIATIRSAEEPEWTKVVADGSDAVLLNVYQQPDGNTVQIQHDLAQMLTQYRAEASKDIKVSTWYDQSDLVKHSVDSLRDASVIGVGLAILVLWLFLANVRVTLIASACVPLVLGMTLLVLRATGQSLDIMTLGGMAAAVGLILDDGIVMVEHGIRRLREHGVGQKHMVLQAAREMTGALTGSSLATVVVFVPLAFLGGVTGAFFKALALTIASSLAISYLFSLLAVPLLAHWMLRDRDAMHKDVGRVLQHVLHGYNGLLRRLLARPLWLIVALIPMGVVVWLAYQAVGTGFMPAMDEGGFVLDYRAPAGTSLAETDRRLRQIEEILASTPEVASYSRRTGLALGGFITEANEGDYFIRLKPLPRRPIDEVMDEIRDHVAEQVPGVEIELALLMEDLIGDLTAVPQPIEIKVFGGDPAQLEAQAERIAKDIESIPDVVDVKSGVVLAGDAVNIRVDHMKAELLGLDPEKLTRLAQVALEGIVTTHVQRAEKMVGIRVWTDEPVRSRIERIQEIPLMTSDGTLVRFGRVATFEKQVGQPQITRENLKTMVAVTARISGRDMGSVMEDVKARVNKLGLPSGNYVEYGGLYKVQQESFQGLVLVTVAAALLVFTVLLYMYESLAAALSILLVSLLAAAAVFPALWWTGIELNITSMVGLTMIVGISAEASIFFMSQWQESNERLASHDALLEAGRLRLRPILMTALAAILALLPLALGVGQGSAMLQPLAVAIIAGLLFTVPAVLIALPVLVGTLTRPRAPTLEPTPTAAE